MWFLAKELSYVVRLLAKELIMLLACCLCFILKVLFSSIFALTKQINLHEPSQLVWLTDPFWNFCFGLFLYPTSLAFQILFF